MKRSTLHTEVIKGTPILVPNRADEVDTKSPHWFISYNNYDRADYGCDTTALVLGQGECFFILNGDHREGFRNEIEAADFCNPALVRCLAYLHKHKDVLNSKSDPLV